MLKYGTIPVPSILADTENPFTFRSDVDNSANNARIESFMDNIPVQRHGVTRVFLQELPSDDVRENDSTSGQDIDFPHRFPSLANNAAGFLSLITNQPYIRPSRWFKPESFTLVERTAEVMDRGRPGWVNVVRYLRFQDTGDKLQGEFSVSEIGLADHDTNG